MCSPRWVSLREHIVFKMAKWCILQNIRLYAQEPYSCTWQLRADFKGSIIFIVNWDYLSGQCLNVWDTILSGDLIRLASFSTILTIKFISMSKYCHGRVDRISMVSVFWVSEHRTRANGSNICVSIYLYMHVAVPWKLICSPKMTFICTLCVTYTKLRPNYFTTPFTTQWMDKLAFYLCTHS